jgi:hypothetical protein
MRRRIFATALLALCAAAATISANARDDGLRCGSKLVVIGDTRDSVRHKCGDPADITHSTEVRRPSFAYRGRLFYEDEVAVEVENWVYNLGPNKFMRRVRFVDGIVEDIESLDYGYHE